MADFIIGTTPTFTIQLSNGVRYRDLGEKLFFRFKQGNTIIDAEPDVDASSNLATVKLRQEDTLRFRQGDVQVQLIGVNGNSTTEIVVKSDIAIINARDTIINTAYHN